MKRKPSGFWTKENVFAEAKKYKTRGEFQKGCGSAYGIALKNNWISEMNWFKEVHKPNGFWTKENVFAAAKKYKTKGEFERGCVRAYEVARKNGWLEEMEWFEEIRKSRGFWTKENVFAEAKKYKTKSDFFNGCGRAYNVARRNGWFSEMSWFKEIRKPNGFWTKKNVFEEAKKYTTRSEFAKKCGEAYDVARVNGWFDEMRWFVEGKRLNGFWTKENVFAEAKKYQTRAQFAKDCGSAYGVARVNGWLDEMVWLVDGRIKLFTDKIDCVYKYYFNETNSIYIGRTINKNERDNQHKTNEKDAVYKYADANGLEVPVMEIIEDNLTIEEGLDREDYWKNYYKNKGYNVLNTAKTGIGCGSIGAIACGKWNKKSVFAEAKKYRTKGEFSNCCSRAYEVARVNGWLEKMSWFKETCKPNGFWTKENVFEEAKKYQTRTQFAKDCGSAYNVAYRNGWLDEMSWFISPQKPRGFWTKENVFTEAKKYQTRTQFQKGCVRAYDVAYRNGWLDEMEWLTLSHKPNGFWTKENTFVEAKKYKTRGEFQKGCNRAYYIARVNGWLDELFPKAA